MKLDEILTSQDVADILANFLKKSLDEKLHVRKVGAALVNIYKIFGASDLDFTVDVQRKGTVFEIFTYYGGSRSSVRKKTVQQVLQHILDVASDPRGWELDNAPRSDE